MLLARNLVNVRYHKELPTASNALLMELDMTAAIIITPLWHVLFSCLKRDHTGIAIILSSIPNLFGIGLGSRTYS